MERIKIGDVVRVILTDYRDGFGYGIVNGVYPDGRTFDIEFAGPELAAFCGGPYSSDSILVLHRPGCATCLDDARVGHLHESRTIAQRSAVAR